MSVTRIASRYAKSLLDLAIEENQAERVLEDMNHLKEAVKSRDLYLMLKSPIINVSKKKEIMKVLFESKFDKMSMGFIDIILRKGRETYLPEISQEFEKQYKKYKRVSTAVITSAQPLSETAVAKIKAKLLASNITDDSVELQTKIDPSLIGGFVIEIGDKLYDASVSGKLAKLKKEFVGNNYKVQY